TNVRLKRGGENADPRKVLSVIHTADRREAWSLSISFFASLKSYPPLRKAVSKPAAVQYLLNCLNQVEPLSLGKPVIVILPTSQFAGDVIEGRLVDDPPWAFHLPNSPFKNGLENLRVLAQALTLKARLRYFAAVFVSRRSVESKAIGAGTIQRRPSHCVPQGGISGPSKASL